jgi:hypothetical protein
MKIASIVAIVALPCLGSAFAPSSRPVSLKMVLQTRESEPMMQ